MFFDHVYWSEKKEGEKLINEPASLVKEDFDRRLSATL